MKFLIGCNLLTSVSSLAYPSHMQFWHQLGKKYPNDEFLFFAPRRMSIDRMRNEAARLALAQDCDYLFFYDDDVILPDDTLDVLLDTPGYIRAGITCVRSYPFDPMIFKYVQNGKDGIYSMTFFNDYEDYKDENGVVECAAVGFSCCMIDVNLLKELSPPYFVTGPNNTEDVYFCHKANNEVRRNSAFPMINVNTNLVTGHIMDQYYVSPGNKEHYMKFEENLNEQFPGTFQAKNREDRDNEYREKVMERLRRASSQV